MLEKSNTLMLEKSNTISYYRIKGTPSEGVPLGEREAAAAAAASGGGSLYGRAPSAAEERKKGRPLLVRLPMALVQIPALQPLQVQWDRGHPSDHTKRQHAANAAAWATAMASGALSDAILAGAETWIKAADAPRYLPKLSDWLDTKSWEKEPPTKTRASACKWQMAAVKEVRPKRCRENLCGGTREDAMKSPPETGKDIVIKTTHASDGKVPARKSRNYIANFLALTDEFDKQIKTFDELHGVWRERDHRIDLSRKGKSVEYAKNLLKRAREGAEQCITGLQQQWDTEKLDIYHPSAGVLMVRIGGMVMAWPDAKLSTPEDYAGRLADRLEAEDLNMMTLESVFREIEDTMKKAPAIADVLPLLGKHKKKWETRLAAIDLDQIQRLGEQTIFALQHKHEVFEDAVMEYLEQSRLRRSRGRCAQ